MKTFYSLILILAVVLSACGPGGELQDLRTQVETLQGELTEAQTALEESQARVAELEATGASVAELESALDEAESAIDEALEETEDNAEDIDADVDADADEVESADDVIEDLTSTEDEAEVDDDADEDADAEDEVDADADVEADEDIEVEAETDEADELDAEDVDDAEAEDEDVETGNAEAVEVDEPDTDDADDSEDADDAEDSEEAVEAEEVDEEAEDTEAEDSAETDEEADAEAVDDAESDDEPAEDTEDSEEDSDDSDASAASAVAATGAGAAALVASLPDGAAEGGSVTVAITAEPPGWDPSASTSQEIARVMYHNVFEGLVRFDESGDIVPALAESWELSEDGLSWTFELRENVKFHDGSDLTPEDVVAKFERATDEASGHTNPQYYVAIESVEADGNTIIFNLSEASSSLLYNLARPDSIIYPAALADTQRSEPIGTGPFRFAEYTEGSEVRLERFEDYYLDGVPFLDEVVFQILDENARFAALQAGDVDLIGTSLAPEQFSEAQDIDGLVAEQGNATTEITLAMNNAREPFDNPLVRQAITHAIDKNAIVDGAMFGLGTVIGSHVTPSERYFVDLEPYPYDPERARELLAEAGYEDGLEISFELPEPYNIERRTGEVIAQQLSDVGIEVDLSVVEWGTWIQRIFLGADYDMTIIGHSEPRDINVYADPDYYYGYAGTEGIAERLAQIEQSPDADEQNELFVQIAETVAEDAVNVWVFAPPYLVAARDDIGGYWTNQPTPSIDATQMYRVEN